MEKIPNWFHSLEEITGGQENFIIVTMQNFTGKSFQMNASETGWKKLLHSKAEKHLFLEKSQTFLRKSFARFIPSSYIFSRVPCKSAWHFRGRLRFLLIRIEPTCPARPLSPRRRVSYTCTVPIWNSRTRVLSLSVFGLLFDVNHLLSCYRGALLPCDRCAWNTRAATSTQSSVHARTRSTGTGAAVLSTRKRAHVHKPAGLYTGKRRLRAWWRASNHCLPARVCVWVTGRTIK